MSKVLLIVDMQRDFMPRWMDDETVDEFTPALPVPGANRLLPNIVLEAYSGYDLVIATRDFHPGNHMSFKELGGDWPMHCVAGSEGAQLLPNIDMVADVVISKGTDAAMEAYSGFDGTVLADIISSLDDPDAEAPEVVIMGVATDYCVTATALDAAEMGFKTTVLLDCIAGVDPETTEVALDAMDEVGITLRTRG